MGLISSVGVLIPAETHDAAGDARRLESLGFRHGTLLQGTTTQLLLALGATRKLQLRAPQDAIGNIDELGEMPPAFLRRLERSDSTTHPILTVDPHDPRLTRAAIAREVADRGMITLGIAGPHDSGVRKLALDVLDISATGRSSDLLYAEELTVGQRFELGDYELTVDEIIAFAERFDPLDFHLDPDLARTSPLGILCASGMHTQAIMQRLNTRGFHRSVAVVAGRGSLGLRLLKPATPGLILAGATEILDVRLRPNGRAIVTIRSTLHADGELMLEQTGELVVQQAPTTQHADGRHAAHTPPA